MGGKSINVVTWNVNRHGAEVLDALKDFPQPDVLTLQEVTFNQRKEFEERLVHDMGLKYCPDDQGDAGGKGYGNLTAIASRWTFDSDRLRSKQEPPLPQLLVQASVSANGRSFLVINVHIPNGSRHGWKKIDTFKALKEAVGEAKGRPCIVAGDFNEPRFVPLQDGGRIVTWGQEWNRRGGHFNCWGDWTFHGRTGKGKEWDDAVRWIFEEHDEHQLRHAYWAAHGRGVMPVSHVTHGQPRWFDHTFVSRDFRVERCEYLHQVRSQRHSDHSALSARLTLD